MTVPPIHGTLVVDLSSWIAGAYCTRLLADGGADVVKVEAPDGDPLRRWSASGAPIDPDTDGALFNYLATSKRSIVVDPRPPADPSRSGTPSLHGSEGLAHQNGGGGADLGALHDLLASADAVVWSPGPLVDAAPSLSAAEIRRAHPHLVVTAISPFGLDGAWSDRPATEFTLQAWSGGIVRLNRGRPDRAPAHVGGQVGEWLAGTFAAIGTLAARRRSGGELVDVSMLESLAMGLTYYPVTFHDFLGKPIREDRFVPTPGVAEASDGTVGLGTGTGQQWLDFCAMVGRPDWEDNPAYFADRTSLKPEIDAWVADHTVEEILELASAFRLPNAPIANGANLADIEHLRTRRCFVKNPRDGVLNPRAPFRFSSAGLRGPEPAPRLGEHAIEDRDPRARPAVDPASDGLPYEGLRVLDMTSFWAGPLTGHLIALLGAEVIHLESARRPDGARLVGGVPQTEDRYLERGPIYAALNTNKKSLGIDLSDTRGVELLKEFIGTCDVLIENYTPRVLDQLGLDHDTLHSLHPDLITVRMPGFGLDGPWRDKAAFAFVIEDASGFTWLTGHPDGPPIEPYSIGDPNAGLHAAVGLQLALEHRDRTGEGGLVEVAMIDAALSVTAEQVIEHSAYGAVVGRTGNRGPVAAPQNLYQVAGVDEYGQEDCWVAIAVATDDQWTALVDALGHPDWATDPALTTAAGRREHHDRIDAELQDWCRHRSADEVIDHLWGAGVPVAEVIQPQGQVGVAPFGDRGFFEELDHPVAGRARYATLPMRFSAGPDRLHHAPAPPLGHHTAELLAEIGVSPTDVAALRADGVIGGPPTTDERGA